MMMQRVATIGNYEFCNQMKIYNVQYVIDRIVAGFRIDSSAVSFGSYGSQRWPGTNLLLVKKLQTTYVEGVLPLFHFITLQNDQTALLPSVVRYEYFGVLVNKKAVHISITTGFTYV